MLLNKIINHDLFFSLSGMNEAEKFEQTLSSRMASYGLELSSETLSQLTEYYRLLTHWNDRLHLVAPCAPEQFATRHVLES
jgi:16S rRNA G527 N7-methylase RsmG